MDIQQFISSLTKTGAARTALFIATVNSPAGISLLSGGNADLSFRCESADIPGRQIGTQELIYYGPPQQIGFASSYEHAELTFILSPNFQEKLFFERWQDLVVGRARSTGTNSAGMFDIGYYDDYKGTVQIDKYDNLGAKTYSCKLLEAYPVTIGSVRVDWNDDTIAKFTVSFAYRFFQDENTV